MLSFCSSNATFRYVQFGDGGTGGVGEKAAPTWQQYVAAFPDFHLEVVATREGRNSDGKASGVCENVNSETQALDIGIGALGLGALALQARRRRAA